MHKIDFRFLASMITFLLVLTSSCNQKGRTIMSQTTKCSMQVWINQSVEKVSGRPWPRYDDGKPLEMTTTSEPCETTLHLPDGRALDLQSKSTTLEQDQGIVTAVITLPLFSLVDFKTAIAKAHEVSQDIGVRDPKFYETIAAWGARAPTTDAFAPKYMVRTNLEPSVNLYLELKHHPTQEGWFVSLDFERNAGRRSN